MNNPTNNSRAWQQTPSDWWLDLFPLPVPMRVFVKDKISLLLVIKARKCTLKSRTGPQQLLNFIYSISIVFCKLYTVYSGILQEIRTLPWDWGNSSIWVFQTHSQGAVLVPSFASPVIPLFMKQLASPYLLLRSERANKESAFTSVDSSWSWVCQWGWRAGRDWTVETWSCWVGQECFTGARFYFGVGPLQEQSQSVWHYGGHPNVQDGISWFLLRPEPQQNDLYRPVLHTPIH